MPTVSNPSYWSEIDDALTEDRPLIVGQHLVRERSSTVTSGREAFWGTSGTYDDDAPGGSDNINPSTSDDPAAVNSHYRIYDRDIGSSFSPDSTISSTDAYLWGDLDSDDGEVVDIAVVGYNFSAVTFDITLRLRLMEYQDNSSLTGNLQSRTISSTDPRQGLVYLALPNQYTGVGGWRLHLDASGTMDSGDLPGITEVMIGRRCQLGVNPLRPYDLDSFESDAFQFFSESGYVSTVVRHRGRWEKDVTFELETGNNRYGWSDVDFIKDLGLETIDFVEPFAVFPDPGTTPTRGHWIQATPPGLRLPEVGRRRREWSQTWRELPPFYRIRTEG